VKTPWERNIITNEVLYVRCTGAFKRSENVQIVRNDKAETRL
jgi:hypothetical protein